MSLEKTLSERILCLTSSIKELAEIGELHGISREAVSQKFGKLKEFNLPNIKSDFYDKGKPIE